MAAAPKSAPDRTELIQRLDHTRGRISQSLAGLAAGLDLRSRLRDSFIARPVRLVGLASAAGLLVGLLRGGSRSRDRRRDPRSAARTHRGGLAPLAPDLLKFLVPLLKPAVAAWVARAIARRSRSGR